MGQTFFRHTETQTVTYWKDNNTVRNVCSDPLVVEQMGECSRGDRHVVSKIRELNRPEVIHQYNLRMGGVDRR